MDDREVRRLAALDSYQVLDTPVEASFDEIASLASAICEAPVALVNFVGDGRQFFKAEVGFGARTAPIEGSFCAHALSGDDLLIVPDATLDPQFRSSPLVAVEGGVRFYAGVLLRSAEGYPLGSLCVLDHRPRELTEVQKQSLRVLGQQVMSQLELRRVIRDRDEGLRLAEQQAATLARAQIDLVDSEARFRNMADHAPVMMWVTEPDGACIYLNRGWYDFTGQTEQEALGFGWLEATHPDDKATAEQAFLAANAAQQPFRIEYRLRRRDGHYRWAIDTAAPRFDVEGNYLGYVGSVIDIDERREAEERLRESEEQLRLATDAADIGFWDVDVDQDTLFWPARVKAMFGISAHVPITLADFYAGLHPDDFAATASAFAAAMDPDLRALYDVEYRTVGREDGIVRWVAAKGRGMFDEEGRCYRVLGTAIDISQRKATEAALHELNETLEQRIEEEVAQRARAEEALRQAQKMEAVGQLTGGIAHDFNNMLTGVIGSLDLIQRNLASGRMDRVDRYIDAATTSAQRAAALTARLLAFGRRQSLDLQPTDVNRLVSGMEDLLHRTLGEQVALEAHLATNLWAACTDANQLESALLNLCINARDAMPEGGKLTIETANAHLDERYVRDHGDVEPGDYIVLCVSDTGIGMAPETLEKVFEPFFTTKPVGQGTGLGLSMIYGFARQSGGHVRIYSELGQGTTIKLYVPRFDGEVEVGAEGEGSTPLGSGETVMVVEDDPSVRLIVLEVLEELGYRAVEAVDARTAIPILQSKRRIDLLVSDVGLPGMNGRQLAEIARQTRPSLRILFITGYAENAAVRGGFLDHGMEMMTKPFAVDALATKIREMLSR